MHPRDRAPTVLTALATVLVLAPAAVADGGWLAGSGAPEPNTRYDTAGVTWATANAEPVERVYFNGVVVRDSFPSVAPQPDGGSMIYEDVMTFVAALGFWRDCNGDGYVGAKVVPASFGSWATYPEGATDVDDRVCPPGSPYRAHGWVDEFRWIGPGAGADPHAPCAAPAVPREDCPRLHADANGVNDADARVWGDIGYPDGVAFHSGPLLIRDTFDDSSSTVDRFDRMFGGFVETRVDGVAGPGTWSSKPSVGACDGDDSFLGGPHSQCGLYPLYQVKRLVNDSDSNHDDATPLVRVFDTDADDGNGASPCDDTMPPGGARMADLDPGLAADPLMRGSVGGTIVNVHRGTGGGSFDGSCAPFAAPDLEADESAFAGKTHANARLVFHPGTRFTWDAAGARDAPVDPLGVLGGPTGVGGPGVGPWRGGPRWVADEPLLRHTGGALTDPRPTTMYADVGAGAFASNPLADPTIALPARAQDAHAYGAEACDGNYDDSPANRVPNALGWTCSRALWHADAARGVGPGVLVGDAYDLRDVDCYDMTPAPGARVPAFGLPASPVTPEGYPVRGTCEEVL